MTHELHAALAGWSEPATQQKDLLPFVVDFDLLHNIKTTHYPILTSWIHFTFLIIYVRFILILSNIVQSGPPYDLFIHGLPTKILYAIHFLTYMLLFTHLIVSTFV